MEPPATILRRSRPGVWGGARSATGPPSWLRPCPRHRRGSPTYKASPSLTIADVRTNCMMQCFKCSVSGLNFNFTSVCVPGISLMKSLRFKLTAAIGLYFPLEVTSSRTNVHSLFSKLSFRTSLYKVVRISKVFFQISKFCNFCQNLYFYISYTIFHCLCVALQITHRQALQTTHRQVWAWSATGRWAQGGRRVGTGRRVGAR